jgi:hypothetical protein
MQKMFGLILIIALIWFGLSAYTGDGMGGIDLGSWTDPIGGERDAEGEKLGYTEPESWESERGTATGRVAPTKAESVPQAMKRKVMNAYDQAYDRAGGN